MNLLIRFDERDDLEDAVEVLEARRLFSFWVVAWLGSSDWCSAAERVTADGGRYVPPMCVSSSGAAMQGMALASAKCTL